MTNIYDDKAIGERVKKAIKERGYSQTSITDPDKEKHLNMVRQTLSQKIRGNTPFTLSELVEIANFLDVSVSYLLCEDDYTSKEKEVIGKSLRLREETIDRLSQYSDVQISMLNSLICYPHKEESKDNLIPLLDAIYEYKLISISDKSKIKIENPIYNLKNTYTKKEDVEKYLKYNVISCVEECLKDDYWITDWVKGWSTEMYLYENDPDNSSLWKAAKELKEDIKKKKK